jgi:hypothetical protein
LNRNENKGFFFDYILLVTHPPAAPDADADAIAFLAAPL